MNGQDSNLVPSLAQHFEPPEDYTGLFGWMCGYSADAAFLNDALERFTRQTLSQRGDDGRAWMALMLDPGNSVISFADAPGIAHLPFLGAGVRPFSLLHAKVALLGFSCISQPERWFVRLIVATGNWTRQTLEESLDLAWRIDLDSSDLANVGPEVKSKCADVGAAWSLLQWLSEYFDKRLLEAGAGAGGRMAEAARARARLDDCLRRCTGTAGEVAPRFFDNRGQSLLAQLANRVKATGSAAGRNYLAMGSGFYEAPGPSGTRPTVPFEIRDTLRGAGLLTNKAEVDLFVNPAGCQAIAHAVEAITLGGIKVRSATSPEAVYGENGGRTLHAKFLFSANWRENSVYCASPWVYIGSGNLTGPGFTQAAGTNGGNLEVGVVFAPQPLRWYEDPSESKQEVLTNLLPLQWEKTYTSPEGLIPGNGFPERPDEYVAGPVAWLEWHSATEGGELVAPGPVSSEYDVLDSSHNACAKRGGAFLWPGQRPRQVVVQWRSDDARRWECPVPVIDEFGRISGTTLPALDIQDAWWQLADFPLPPPADEVEPGDGEDPPGSGKTKTRGDGSNGRVPGTYPIRQMMELVENIAAKQTAIGEHDWLAWCARLEQTLRQASGAEAIETFAALGLNPLSPLWAQPFRPSFAESGHGSSGQGYEELLGRVEAAWGVVGLTPIGESK